MDWLFDLPSPLKYVIVLPAEFGIIALVMFGLKKVGVNVRATWLQGVKNAFFTSLFLCAIVGAIAIIPVLGFDISASYGLSASYAIMLAVMLFWFYFNLFSVKFKAGRELLDVTAIPNGWLFFIIGIIGIVVGFLGYADFISKDTKYSWLTSIAIGLSSGAYFVIMSFSHMKIHKNGILVYVDLIKWSRIESFDWIDDNGKSYTLKLRYKGKMPAFLRNGAVPVPIDKKAQLESLLEQFLPEKESMQNRA